MTSYAPYQYNPPAPPISTERFPDSLRSKIDPGALEEAKPVWNQFFKVPPEEQLLFECTGKVLDSRGVFDVHLFVSTKFLSILIDNHTPYVFTLKTIVSWCKAVKDVIPSPPYVRLKPIPNQPGKPVPPGMPSAVQVYTKDERLHMFFDLSVHCDLLCYMLDIAWRGQNFAHMQMAAGYQRPPPPPQMPLQPGTMRPPPMNGTQIVMAAMGNVPPNVMGPYQQVLVQQQQQPGTPPSLSMQQQQQKLMVQQQKLILQQQQLIMKQLMAMPQSPEAQKLLAQQQQLFHQQKQILDNQLQMLKH